jgi:hypothetical protein
VLLAKTENGAPSRPVLPLEHDTSRRELIAVLWTPGFANIRSYILFKDVVSKTDMISQFESHLFGLE